MFDICKDANIWTATTAAVVFVFGPIVEYAIGKRAKYRIADGVDPKKVSGSIVEFVIKAVIFLFTAVFKRRNKDGNS